MAIRHNTNVPSMAFSKKAIAIHQLISRFKFNFFTHPSQCFYGQRKRYIACCQYLFQGQVEPHRCYSGLVAIGTTRISIHMYSMVFREWSADIPYPIFMLARNLQDLFKRMLLAICLFSPVLVPRASCILDRCGGIAEPSRPQPITQQCRLCSWSYQHLVNDSFGGPSIVWAHNLVISFCTWTLVVIQALTFRNACAQDSLDTDFDMQLDWTA